jgi:hypothetical protein
MSKVSSSSLNFNIDIDTDSMFSFLAIFKQVTLFLEPSEADDAETRAKASTSPLKPQLLKSPNSYNAMTQ